ncbi:hypothetical protein [Methylobacterium brachiatum]|uniref:hypothetical protein n=1 Tax=Methylobacterium brachiatum TaxID=269660 RepID=UPI0024486B9C|nr:hypothetical protein [Methylobacterium brachiatum]MDH2313125.1 hypothetical protein [Methylobacterium brachiatum]
MTERDIVQRLHALCLMADRHRAPSHRHTAEDFVAQRDEIRDGLRRCYRELTGNWPGHEADAAGPERRQRPPVPTAILRHRERTKAARA